MLVCASVDEPQKEGVKKAPSFACKAFWCRSRGVRNWVGAILGNTKTIQYASLLPLLLSSPSASQREATSEEGKRGVGRSGRATQKHHSSSLLWQGEADAARFILPNTMQTAEEITQERVVRREAALQTGACSTAGSAERSGTVEATWPCDPTTKEPRRTQTACPGLVVPLEQSCFVVETADPTSSSSTRPLD